MNELLTKKLSEIVTEHHQTAQIFEKYNLDYCCKGKRSLQEACIEINVPVDVVVEDIKNSYFDKTNELDFNCFKLPKLADYIVHTHHSYIKQTVPQILAWLQKVSSKHGKWHNELYNISELFVELSNEMNHHMLDEETVLFALIKQLEQNSFEPIPFEHDTSKFLKLPINHLEHEHEDAGEKMGEIKRLTDNYTPLEGACTTFQLLYASLQAFEVDLHHHIHLENNILFPKALALKKQLRLSFFN